MSWAITTSSSSLQLSIRQSKSATKRLDFDSALNWAERALLVDTHDAEAQSLVAGALFDLNRLAEAEVAVDKFVSLVGPTSLALRRLSEIAVRRKQLPTANQLIIEALEIDSRDPDNHHLAAWISMKLGDFDAAEMAAKKAEELGFGNPAYSRRLSQIRETLKK